MSLLHLITSLQPNLVENVREVLKLSLDNKGVVVATGELTVYLDGLTVDQEQLQNGNVTTTTTSEFSSCVYVLER